MSKPACGTGGGGTTFVTRPSTVVDIAVDATHLYWIESGAVMKCATSGCECNPTVVAPASPGGPIAVGGTSVYWIDDVSNVITLKQCPASGCVGSPTVIATAYIPWIALDATNLYWIEFIDSGWAVTTCPLAGCPGAPTTITTVPTSWYEPAQIVVGDEAVYWTNTGNGGLAYGPVLGCAKTGCSSPTSIINKSGLVIGVHGSSLYWGKGLGVETCVLQGSACAATPLVPSAPGPPVTAIAVDSDGVVYWTANKTSGNQGVVQKCAPGCTSATTLASGLPLHDYPIGPIAVDATHVYWASDGVIARAAK